MRAFQFLFAVALASPDTLVDQLRRAGANNIKVHHVQLDSDAALEAVVQYDLPESGVHAVVLNSENGGWNRSGKFNSWWNYNKADTAKFLEFRETVERGVNDLIVRTRSGGTEEERTTLEIHRLRNGAMVNVLAITEELSAMEHPSGEVFSTTARASYSPGRVIVKTVKNPGKSESCQVFRWNHEQFRFERKANVPGTSCP